MIDESTEAVPETLEVSDAPVEVGEVAEVAPGGSTG